MIKFVEAKTNITNNLRYYKQSLHKAAALFIIEVICFMFEKIESELKET